MVFASTATLIIHEEHMFCVDNIIIHNITSFYPLFFSFLLSFLPDGPRSQQKDGVRAVQSESHTRHVDINGVESIVPVEVRSVETLLLKMGACECSFLSSGRYKSLQTLSPLIFRKYRCLSLSPE